MYKTKIKKGISLIVLVITIIIMIILASAIIISLNDSGVIDNANKAKYDTLTAHEKQEVYISESLWVVQKDEKDNTYTLKTFMEEKLGKIAESIVDNGDGTLTITMKDTGNEYTVGEKEE